MGWEPQETTRYYYSESGRLKKAVTTREPEWSDDDYELVTSYAEYENQIHAECGHPISETTSFLADPDNSKGEYFYKAGLPYRCHACTALELAKAPYKGDSFDPARMWTVDKVMR